MMKLVAKVKWIINRFIIYLRRVMKTGSANIKFLLTIHNFPCLKSCLLCSLSKRVFYFDYFGVRELCRTEFGQSYYRTPSPAPRPYFLSLPRLLSLIQVTIIWNQCAPKSGFGAVRQFTLRYWSPWENFPGEHNVKLWDGTKLLRLAESASYNIVLCSRFIWLNWSMTLIRAGRER